MYAYRTKLFYFNSTKIVILKIKKSVDKTQHIQKKTMKHMFNVNLFYWVFL